MIEATDPSGAIPWVASSLRRASRVELGVDAVRALEGSSRHHPVKLHEVLTISPASRKFLSMVMTSLRHASIIHSTRGHHGGYWLDRPLDQISLLDIIDALAPPVPPSLAPNGLRPPGASHDALGAVWAEVDAEARSRLRAVSLERLVTAAVPSV